MPQSPNNTLEQVLCDADLLHLAQDDYFKKADLLHKEIESTKLCKISEKEWLNDESGISSQPLLFHRLCKITLRIGSERKP